MSSTSDRNNRITDEEQTRMHGTTESDASEHVNVEEELMIVDRYPRRALCRRKLQLIFATYRAASGVFLAWAGVHYFRAGVIEPWLNAYGPWYWFGFGVLAALLVNELGESLTSLSDALDWYSATRWYARQVEAMPLAERVRAVPTSEVSDAGTWRPTRSTSTDAGESR